MATTTNLDTLKINYLTQTQYDTALANNQINSNELYFTPSPGDVVEQNATSSSDNGDFRVLLSGTASDNNLTETVRKTSQITYNPSTFSFKHYAGSTQAAGSYIESNGEKLTFITPSSDSAELSYSGLKLNNSRLISTDIDKLHTIGSNLHIDSVGSAVAMNTASTWTVLKSFTISEAGTYLLNVTGIFPANSNATARIIRLTDNSSTTAVHTSAEASMVGHANNQNKVHFSVILNLEATTYRIQGWSATALGSTANCYVSYSYVRLS